MALALIEVLLSRISRTARCRQKERVCSEESAPSISNDHVEVGDVFSENQASEKPSLTVVEEPVSVLDDESEMLWKEARSMIHNEIPSFETDGPYLTLVYKAALAGHVEAMSKLGDYAFRRGELVETFYWKQQVEFAGGCCCCPSLADIIAKWIECGCPEEYENVTDGFSERQGVFARAVLRLVSGLDPEYATKRLEELAAAGDADALCFLGRSPCRGCLPTPDAEADQMPLGPSSQNKRRPNAPFCGIMRTWGNG